MPYLFSFGSNHVDQLGDRIGREVVGEAAYLPDYQRVFRGWSRNWQGGVASMDPEDGSTVYGYIEEVTNRELRGLDRYEGRDYDRTPIVVFTEDGEEVDAIAYISSRDDFNEPTREYLEAIARTIRPFWQGARGRRVTWKDIKVIRPRRRRRR